MDKPVSPYSSFSVLDWIGAIIAVGVLIALALFPLVGRTYASMFQDFGPGVTLPLVTRLVTSAWFPVILSLLGAFALGLGLGGRRSLSWRRAWLVAAFGWGFASLCACWIGTQLPLWKLAGSIQP